MGHNVLMGGIFEVVFHDILGFFCFFLVRIDLLESTSILFNPFWPVIWSKRVQKGKNGQSGP